MLFVNIFNIITIKPLLNVMLSSSIDPDQMPQNAVSDQSLHSFYEIQ